MQNRFQDKASSVRERAIELIGKFVAIEPTLIGEYCEQLLERTLDQGVSVRKRVISVLSHICQQQPDLPEVPQICLRVLRRINDQDTVQVGRIWCGSHMVASR